MKIRLLLLAGATLLGLAWLASRPCRAIPAFSRKYQISCATCHDPFPRLSAYGEQVAANAFAPPDQETPPHYFQEVADDHLSLLGEFPLALRADLAADFRATTGEKGEAVTDLGAPFALKLLSEGRIANDIGYAFALFYDQGSGSFGIKNAYVTFNNLFGTPIDVTAGQFQASDAMFRRDLRLTFEDTLIFAAQPGKSHTTFGYHPGLRISTDFAFGLQASAAVFNGMSTGGSQVRQDFDPDRYRNYLVRLSQRLGPVRFGAFGYYGKETQTITDETTQVSRTATNEVNAWGADLTLSLSLAKIDLQYCQRRDLNPDFNARNEVKPVLSQGILGQATATVAGDPGWLFLTVAFNYVDSAALSLNQEAYSANLTFLVRTNLKLAAEYTFARTVNSLDVNEHRVTLGVVGGL